MKHLITTLLILLALINIKCKIESSNGPRRADETGKRIGISAVPLIFANNGEEIPYNAEYISYNVINVNTEEEVELIAYEGYEDSIYVLAGTYKIISCLIEFKDGSNFVWYQEDSVSEFSVNNGDKVDIYTKKREFKHFEREDKFLITKLARLKNNSLENVKKFYPSASTITTSFFNVNNKDKVFSLNSTETIRDSLYLESGEYKFINYKIYNNTGLLIRYWKENDPDYSMIFKNGELCYFEIVKDRKGRGSRGINLNKDN